MLCQSYKPDPPLCQFVEKLCLYDGYESPHFRERILPSGTFELWFRRTLRLARREVYRTQTRIWVYKIGKANAIDAVIEPYQGGRWYERGDDGSTCDWGTVLTWEPYSRLILSWDISADWQPDPTLKTEIEVRFIANGNNATRVELEHRHLDRYGARRDEMRRVFDTEGDWGRLLASFAQVAERH